MNTPRTDAAWSATFDGEQMSAGQTARALRECSQQLETELATLRAELEKVYALVTPVGFDLPGGIFETAQAVTELRAERDQLRTEVKSCGELSCDECNARTAAFMVERDQLRGALALGQQNCDDAYDDLRTERDAALARAERAEASLHAAKEECTDVRLKWHAVMGICAAKEDSIMEAHEELFCLRARAERAEAEVGRLRAGIAECLRTNGHLADGEDCTLISLKRCLRAIDAAMKEDEK